MRRLSYLCRYSDLIPRFCRPVPVLSMITKKVFEFIYAIHSHRILQLTHEGLNGVNRQPSNGPKINRQSSKEEHFYCQPSSEQGKISCQISKITIVTALGQVMLLIIHLIVLIYHRDTYLCLLASSKSDRSL